MRFRPTILTAANAGLWSHGKGSSGQLVASKSAQFQTASGQQITAQQPLLVAEHWTAMAMRYDAPSKTAALAVGGITRVSKTGLSAAANGTGTLLIGKVGKAVMFGAIGDVRLSNRALADDELLKYPLTRARLQ